MNNDDRIRVVLCGDTMALHPTTGGHWSVWLQYLLGLRGLGVDFVWLELYRPKGRPAQDRENVRTFLSRFQRWGFRRNVALAIVDRGRPARSLRDLEVLGMDRDRLVRFAEQSDVLWNMHCAMDAPLLSHFRRKALIDVDPGHLQLSALHWDMGIDGHDTFFTVGQNLNSPDCPVPRLGKHWQPFLPPMFLPFWRPIPLRNPQARFSSVTQWNWGEIPFGNGTVSISKRDAYMRYLDVPARSGVPIELAANLATDDATGDREALVESGWRLVLPDKVGPTPATYRAYIARSRGEFGCAKPVFSVLRTGWVSDRSAAYLASGRPVVVEDTGISRYLPVGQGILIFATAEEACARLADCLQDYDVHCRTARCLAEQYFDSAKILPRLLTLSMGEEVLAGRRAAT
jgi:hypothetical protein